MNYAVQKQSQLFFETDNSQVTQITREIWTTHGAEDSSIQRLGTVILRAVPDISKNHGAFIFRLEPLAPEPQGTTILPNNKSYSQNNKVSEGFNLQQNCCENLKSHNKWTLLLLSSYSKKSNSPQLHSSSVQVRQKTSASTQDTWPFYYQSPALTHKNHWHNLSTSTFSDVMTDNT